MRQLRIAVIGAIVVIVGLSAPALAGRVSDANDPVRRLDLRAVAVVPLETGDFRVTITFHHRVRLRWFDDDAGAQVRFTHDREVRPYWFFTFTKRFNNRLRAQLCEGGSGCGARIRVRRPNAYAIRARLEPLHGAPQEDWPFRARSFRFGTGGAKIDGTSWGRI